MALFAISGLLISFFNRDSINLIPDLEETVSRKPEMECLEELYSQSDNNYKREREASPSEYDDKKMKANAVSPVTVRRPRNLRVQLEKIDYRDSSCENDPFSISLALARISNSKCSRLDWNNSYYDNSGNPDMKLTVLRSLIENHTLHCKTCRDDLHDLDCFDKQNQNFHSVQVQEHSVQVQELRRINKMQQKEISRLKDQLRERNNLKKIISGLKNVNEKDVKRETIIKEPSDLTQEKKDTATCNKRQPLIKEVFSLKEKMTTIFDDVNSCIETEVRKETETKSSLKLRSFSELEQKSGGEAERSSDVLRVEVSQDVPPNTIVPDLGGAVSPLKPGTKVMSSNVLRRLDTDLGLPPGVYKLIKANGLEAVVIVKKSEEVPTGVSVRTEKESGTPLEIFSEDLRKQNILTSDSELARLALKKWTELGEETKQQYRVMAKEAIQRRIKEPQGISLPRTVRRVVRQDPNLPEGWQRKLLKQPGSGEVSVCVITPDKVRLHSREALVMYLTKHRITDIRPESISFSPWSQDGINPERKAGAGVAETEDPLDVRSRLKQKSWGNKFGEQRIFSSEHRNFCVFRYLTYKQVETCPIKKVKEEFLNEYPNLSRVPCSQTINFWVEKYLSNRTISDIKAGPTKQSLTAFTSGNIGLDDAQDPLRINEDVPVLNTSTSKNADSLLDDARDPITSHVIEDHECKGGEEKRREDNGELFASFSSLEDMYGNMG